MPTWKLMNLQESAGQPASPTGEKQLCEQYGNLL